MKVLTQISEIKNLLSDRNPEILHLPPEFAYQVEIDPDYSYTIQKEFSVEGKATFENKDAVVQVSPVRNGRSCFSWNGIRYDLDSRNCIKGNHNIQLGEVKVIEHPLAWMLAFGVYADFTLSESSFPTFDYCDQVYMDHSKGNWRKLEKRKKITVSSPFALIWEKGYCVLEPPTKDTKGLLIDHQVEYPGTTVGRSRILTELTPENFSYFGDARTTAFRNKKDAESFYQIGLAGGLKDYPFTLENVLLLDEDRIYNIRDKFKDPNSDYNYEFICHELIDIMSWLRFVEEKYEGKFFGKMTTFLFDHHKQIDIAQFSCDPEELEKFGIRIGN